MVVVTSFVRPILIEEKVAFQTRFYCTISNNICRHSSSYASIQQNESTKQS